MKLPVTLSGLFTLACAALAIGAIAITESPARNVPAPAAGGLHLSLTTNTLQLNVGDEVQVAGKARTAKNKAPNKLVASVHLANRSNANIPFEFPNQAAAARRFDFRVLNADGFEVWNSTWGTIDAPAGEGVEAVLRKKSKWSNTTQIRLDLGEFDVPNGRYTLEAAVAGEPRIAATTIFEVIGATTVPPYPPNTGIKGTVFMRSSTEEVWVPQPGAAIRVTEVIEPVPSGSFEIMAREPLRFFAITGEDGNFQVDTPPGKYHVSATAGVTALPSITTVGTTNSTSLDPDTIINTRPNPLLGTATVTVTKGRYSTIELASQPVLRIAAPTVLIVEEVSVRVLPTFAPPSMIEVSAKGLVTSGGWTMPDLRYRRVTADGMVEFDFVAKPPTGLATQSISSISATTRVEQPANFRGVRVHAKFNSNQAEPQ